VETHLQVIFVLNSALANGMSWEEIEAMVEVSAFRVVLVLTVQCSALLHVLVCVQIDATISMCWLSNIALEFIGRVGGESEWQSHSLSDPISQSHPK
jgi:hypothetical protein